MVKLQLIVKRKLAQKETESKRCRALLKKNS